MKLHKIKIEQVLYLCDNLLKHYISFLTTDERNIVRFVVQNVLNKSYNESERLLLPIVEKIWNIELASGNYVVVSWNKNVISPKRDVVTFATFSEKNNIIPFCDAVEGIEYRISFESILGALWKDGATFVDRTGDLEENEYVIAKVGNRTVFSFNGATRLITPKQLIEIRAEVCGYNEIILDSSKIEVIGPYKREIEEFEVDFPRKLY